MSLKHLIEKLDKGDITPIALVQASIDKIEATNHLYQAVVNPRFEKALEAAQKDYSNTKFKGIPILIKSLGQPLQGEPSTAASVLLKDSIAGHTSNFVKKIQDLGFIILGQTNSPEFGFKNISDSKLYGDVKSPLNLEKTPGGSSGGAAAALLADYVPVVAASDGGGSIRIPASYGGLVGLKPTRGSMPTGPFGHRGWQGASINFFITKTIEDTEILFESMHQNTIESPFNYVQSNFDKEGPLTIAYTDQSPVNSEVSNDAVLALNKTVEILRELGHTVEKLSPNYDGFALMESYYMVNGVETASMIFEIEKSINKKITIDDIELVSWVLYQYGLKVKAHELVQALNGWDQVSEIMHEFHKTYDLFLTPTNAKAAPNFDEVYQSDSLLNQMKAIESNPDPYKIVWEMFEDSLAYTPFTMLANITGQPAITLPVYENEEKEQFGVQLMGVKGSEALLFKISKDILK